MTRSRGEIEQLQASLRGRWRQATRADAVPAGGDLARPKLIARSDPDHDHVVAGIVTRLLDLPRQAVVLAEDKMHLNLLPHVRASWTPRLWPAHLADWPGTAAV